MAGTPRDPLRLAANPGRVLVSRAPWLATLYLLTYPIVGTIAFVVTLAAGAVAVPLAVTWLVLPALALGAWVMRRCGDAERLRYRLVGPPLRGDHLPMSGVFVTEVRRRWTSAATWRDLGYLIGLYPALLALDVAALAAWVALLALVTCPIWFWSVPGLWIDTLPLALLAALAALVVTLGYQYVLIGVARLHRHAARVMLGPRVDPLAEHRAIVARRPPA